MTPRCFALVPAAGTGARTGATIPKQYLPVAGRPMLEHVIAAFMTLSAVERVVVVVAAGDLRIDDVVQAFPAADGSERLAVCRRGGPTRDASVAAGLAALEGIARDDDWVLVHDAARCGVTPALIASLIHTVGSDPVGGLVALRLDDTVKREVAAIVDVASPVVCETVDRRGLWRAQTPQMFRFRLLVDALSAAHDGGRAVTDESSAMEAAGHRVRLVAGSPRNFKVTTASDLSLMDELLRAASVAAGASDPATDRTPPR